MLCVYHPGLFVFFPWGIPQLQSDWSLSCDRGRDYASECENKNNNNNLMYQVINTHEEFRTASLCGVWPILTPFQTPNSPDDDVCILHMNLTFRPGVHSNIDYRAHLVYDRSISIAPIGGLNNISFFEEGVFYTRLLLYVFSYQLSWYFHPSTSSTTCVRVDASS